MTQFQWSSTGREVVEEFQAIVVDKTIVITGASQGGVGAETAFSLAFGNPKHLVLAGRSEQKIKPVIEEINKTNPSIKTTFVQVDLGSQASVRGAAAAINAAVERIDILINNAAIMACPYTKTEDGIESQFATNYVGHFLLTNLLMEKLLAAGDGTRIVNITSTAGATGEIHLDDINFDDGKSYNPIAAYGQSKVANILFTVSLSKNFSSRKLASFSVHPGSISTGLQKHFHDPATFKECMDYVEAKIGGNFKFEEKKTLQQGCSTTLVAALDPSITGN
ncbi:hypothetical protein OIDMADRAFT_180948 [Oidiodendron maius Zn]|uniref:NAD(P)-binding protein n=1 Tax=Oidiodendron maius (strain Zn) TaxID=913774 RepID=A0A0C3CKH4_OIDMZ|nr:hypothetical protein OIDMADRAFT_180948 [Oidiodendron maius Zn]